MTIDEQKLEVILDIVQRFSFTYGQVTDANQYKSLLAEKILSGLKPFDPEPLEVEVIPWGLNFAIESIRNQIKETFKTKQEAIDFCAKHGLRVKK